MNSRIAPFAMLTLAAAIASEVQAEVTATTDPFEGAVNQSQILSLASLLQNDRLNEILVYYYYHYMDLM